jgi:hypothetical protein
MTTTTPLDVDVYDALVPRYADQCWPIYQQAFEPLRTKAAQRHMLTVGEFNDIMADERIGKYVVPDPDRALKAVPNNPLGLAVMTTDLAAWPLIEPAYFHAKYPDRTIFYVGFVCAAPGSTGVFPALIGHMWSEIEKAGGVAVMDFCDFNVDGPPSIPLRTLHLLRKTSPLVTVERIDAQSFWAVQNRPRGAGRSHPNSDRP